MPSESTRDIIELPNLGDGIEMGGFIASDDLAEIEGAVVYLEQQARNLALLEGLAILRAEQLWNQSGLSSLQEYRRQQHNRLGMTRAAISQRRKMGYAWLDHKRLLRKLDMSSKSNHLLYLDAALKRHGDRKAVLDALTSMSVREFRAYALGERRPAPPLPDVDLSISRGSIKLDGTPVLVMAEEMPDVERDFIGGVLRAAYRARKGACIPHVVAVYDEGEARAVENFLKKHRASK